MSGLCRTVPYMDKRVEVRCSAEELAQWKAAAGDVPLGRWIRRLLNGAAVPWERRLKAEIERELVKRGYMGPLDATGVPANAEIGKSSFRPDFKR